MTRPLLPPKGIFIGTRVVFDADLPAPVKETLLQLMSLAWQSDSHCTPPLTYALLTHLTGKSDRTLRGHFLMLRAYQAVLRLQPAGIGQFMIVLADGLFDNRVEFAPAAPGKMATEAGETLPAPYHDDKHEEEEDLTLLESLVPDLPPLPADHDQANATESASVHPPRSPKLKKAFAARLEQAGVFPHLLGEVAEQAAGGQYTQNELEALLDWCLAETPERPGGLFIFRMRKGLHAPGKLQAPPCPRCGKRGTHDPGCPQRYRMDGY